MTKLDDRIVDLERENADLRRRLDEALAQHAATTEVLQVINASPGELAPVFDAILERAMRLCEAAFGILLRYDGENFHAAAHHGLPAEFARFIDGRGMDGWRGAHLSLVDGAPFVHILDLAEDRATYEKVETRRALVDLGGARSLILVPLQLDGKLLGSLAIYRQEARPFSNRQIALLGEFAVQAVIAMENVRLTAETREALEQQTATADVLGVINSSPGDLSPVFDAMLEKAVRLCEAAYGVLWTYDGRQMTASAVHGPAEIAAALRGLGPTEPRPGSLGHRLLQGEAVVHIANAEDDQSYRMGSPSRRVLVELGKARALLGIALRKDDAVLGLITVYRQEVRPFTDKQIALLQNFAAQAVIAMENARLITETRIALEHQTATAEVLGVISRSTFDLQPVLDTVVQTAARLFNASFSFIANREGELCRPVALYSVSPAWEARLRSQTFPADRGTVLGRAALEGRVVQVADIAADAEHTNPEAVTLGLSRTVLGAPLIREGETIGVLILARQRIEPFTEQQIELIRTFADQAVIAIENTRLITETREALDQQTATAEVLQVINASPGDLAPVFAAMLEKAMRLCDAAFGTLFTRDGDLGRLAAQRNVPPAFADFLAGEPIQLKTILGPNFRDGPVVHIEDLAAGAPYREGVPLARAAVDLGGIRAFLVIPLVKDGAPIGIFAIYRQEARSFTDKQIGLVQNFAAQAVIAMENARLINETREALDQQTATAEVLGVINSSPGDLAPVFDAMLQKAIELCDAAFGSLLTFDGERYHPAALKRVPSGYAEFLGKPLEPSAGTALSRIVHERQVVQFADVKATEGYRSRRPLAVAGVELGGIRTLLVVPLVKDNQLVGVFHLYRTEVQPFTDKQIALLQNFAAQAVIAMENARLLIETRERTADLQESLEYQTATSDVLQAISRSTFDLNTILQTVVSSAFRLCRADQAVIFRNEDGEYRWAAGHGISEFYEAHEREAVIRPGSGTLIGRVIRDGRIVQIADVWTDPLYEEQAAARATGAHSMLGVPLLREGMPIGAIGLARNRIEPFSEREMQLVATFADQAVIAIENARLISETREARDDAETALGDLRAAQASLVQAEKMASLGQLTAGIAHEIKNPLNFVNNFASLSAELLAEVREVAAPALAGLEAEQRAELEETMGLLTGNLEKIAEHGKRADNIVKSMLEHSRGVSGERREVDVNALVEESLNLAYHGARAQDQSFNITLERDFEAGLAPLELVPQDMTRVFLNLFGNGFYAAAKRARANGEAGFRPVLRVATHDDGSAVEVRVRDNGTGIPAAIRDKLFQPFFTTKPTGEGTGLGLSISYDIVTQQHGGTILVESEEGSYTEFTIRLPRQGTRQMSRNGAGL